jgi:hypothetical protein
MSVRRAIASNYHGKRMALPPVFAASALYDNLLQAALRQFFSRATFEIEPIPSLSSDGRLSIEPTNDPSVLSIRWFGSRHVLHVPARRPFTAHEVRLARALGTVLAMRYRAIFDPKQMLERGDLFRGAIEDRYVSAFLDVAGPGEQSTGRADVIATAIEVLRVAALSSYENRAISSGALLLEADEDRQHGLAPPPEAIGYRYTPALTGIKSFYRMSDGVDTLFLLNRAGIVLDIVEIDRYTLPAPLEVPCPAPYRAHARATVGNRNVCVILSPSHEIKVFCDGVQMFSFRNARWHLLDVQAKYDMWETSIGNAPLAERLFQTAIDLADARQGALFVVLRDPATSLPLLVAPADQLDSVQDGSREGFGRRQLLHMLRGRTAVELDPAVLAGLAKTDGATVMDTSGRLLAVGAILLHTEPPSPHSNLAVEGARTTAAMAAGRFGAVLKVSEDGLITFYDNQERIWDI